MSQIASPSSSTASLVSTISQATSQSTPSTPQSANITTASALSSVIPSQSHSSWNVDTGASAHMTFNRHWMCHMTPYCIPICLADGSVLYSEGIGSVRFIPEVNGCQMAPLEFTNVLYVPSLSTNLFSVLYLTIIVISLSQLSWTPFISSEMARLSFKRRPLHEMLHFLLETPFLLKNSPHSHPQQHFPWISPSYIVAFVIITWQASESSCWVTGDWSQARFKS